MKSVSGEKNKKIKENTDEMIGKKFGKLTVLKRDLNTIKKNKRKYYICKCDCGSIKSIAGTYLRTNHIKSCGCLIKTYNLTGQRFGKLIVKKKSKYKKDNKFLCECLCDCGKITYIRTTSLVRGDIRSCGCLKKELNTKRFHKDLTCKKFGKLTVIKKIKQKATNEKIKYKCLCKCGNILNVLGADMVSGSTKSCGCLIKEKRKYPKEFYEISRHKAECKFLTDVYIKGLLTHYTSILTNEDMPLELVEAKRTQIKINRKLKEINNDN